MPRPAHGRIRGARGQARARGTRHAAGGGRQAGRRGCARGRGRRLGQAARASARTPWPISPPGVDGPAGPKALAALAEARKYLGTPYLWGGSKPSTGFDCSGLMQWAYHTGRHLDRPRHDQQIHDGDRRRPAAPARRRHGLLPGLVRLRPPRRHVHRRRQVPARAAHGRRGQDLEPLRAVLRAPVRGRAASGHEHAGRRAGRPAAGLGGCASRPRPPPAAGRPPLPPHPRRARPRARAASRRCPAASRGPAPSSTVQVLKAVEPPAAKPAAAPRPAATRTPPARSPPTRSRLRPPAAIPATTRTPEQYAAWMAAAAQKAGLPPQLPIMAALTESGMHNLLGRRPRLDRLLPDAHERLGSGRVRRLRPEPRSAAEVVHHAGARDQAAAPGARRDGVPVRPAASGATGSPTSSGRRRICAAATRRISTRPISCSARASAGMRFRLVASRTGEE